MKAALKVSLGLLATGIAAYIIIGEELAGVSADATINAQITTLRSPIDGTLAMVVQAPGTRIAAQELVATISDPRPDESRLLDLQRNAAMIESDRTRLQDLLKTLATAGDTLRKTAEEFLAGRRLQLDARLAEARAQQVSAEAKVREADDTLRRATDLASRGVQSALDLTRARSTAEVARQEVEAARSRIRYLTVEAEAAKRGSFMGDAYNDSPQSQQRLREIDLELSRTRAEIEERSRRLTSLQDQIDEERVRAARSREARLVAQAPSLLWDVEATTGEYVRRGQDLAHLVDCTTTIVTSSVSEAVFNGLQVGEQAQFRLLGSSKVFWGSIVRLAGSGAQGVYRALAIKPSPEHLTRFDVALYFPELAKDESLRCAVGRTGRVVFTDRPLDFWRRWITVGGMK